MTEHAKSAMPPEVMAFMGQAVPIKRLADPKDYNGIIVFLASDDSSMLPEPPSVLMAELAALCFPVFLPVDNRVIAF
uniref:Uncharacterized protein n=1 Tax=uncultured Desulfobacterium sp. TaxID=201089 RepID=E1YD07_9BACT|nr:unknown protein [uncultured Desulfobacterium sp.]